MDLSSRLERESFRETAAVLHNIKSIRRSEVAESLIDQLSQRSSIINYGDAYN